MGAVGAAKPYTVLDHWMVGGGGGWDLFVSRETRRRTCCKPEAMVRRWMWWIPVGRGRRWVRWQGWGGNATGSWWKESMGTFTDSGKRNAVGGVLDRSNVCRWVKTIAAGYGTGLARRYGKKKKGGGPF